MSQVTFACDYWISLGHTPPYFLTMLRVFPYKQCYCWFHIKAK